MRAIRYDRQGAADEVLVCGELPTPDAGYGEAWVKLEVSGVNPSDTYRRPAPPANSVGGCALPALQNGRGA
jgi:NADPH:quinone reductase-like Zn-dependent oxidoreductase